MRNKVLVIALDGATFTLLRPWMSTGRLPTLQSFVDEGVSGELQSVVPPITAPAWASFMTGKNPGKHGIYYFFVTTDAEKNRATLVGAHSRAGRTLWSLLSEAGKRVLVLNVPTTYPPERVNGAMISDFLTPPGKRDYMYPSTLLEEIEGKFGPYPLHAQRPVGLSNLSASYAEQFLRELTETLTYHFNVAHYLLDKYRSDFTILHILGTDKVQHELWNLIDETHPQYDSQLAAQFRDQIIEYFCRVDQEIARLMNRMEGDTTTFIMSDHGFGPISKTIDLNVWLLEEGYIAIRQGIASRLRFRLWKMGWSYGTLFKVVFKLLRWLPWTLSGRPPTASAKFLRQGSNPFFFSANDIDWSRTKAYCRIGVGGIDITTPGSKENGGRDPAVEAQALKREIADKLRHLRDPETGEKIKGGVYIREDTFHGEYVSRAPDIIFLPMESGYIAGNVMGFTTHKAIAPNLVWPGNHRLNGILLTKGPPVRAAQSLQGASIMDLAPTILYLMGVAVPSDMDGRVLEELFLPAYVVQHPVTYQEAVPPPIGPREEENAGEMEEVVRRLKELGYLT